MSNPEPTIRVNVDVTNPGQFFACCGLLELADRLWPGAEGWFENGNYCIANGGTLSELLSAAQAVKYSTIGNVDGEPGEDEEEAEDEGIVQPLLLDAPINLRLDWWEDKSLKTWAGSMKVDLIAMAMSNAIAPNNCDPFNQAQIVYTPSQPVVAGGKVKKPKKREPFYFDSRRAMNSHSLDVGFSVNDHKKMISIAYPAVEFLCLVGLQRCRPVPSDKPRIFIYSTWQWHCSVQVAPIAVAGIMRDRGAKFFKFQNGFRSGQKKHKSFRSAIPLSHGD